MKTEHQFKSGEYGLLPVQIFAVGATRILLSLDSDTEALGAADGLPIETPNLVVKHGKLLPYSAPREGEYRVSKKLLEQAIRHALVFGNDDEPYMTMLPREIVNWLTNRKEASDE